jgi:hypothetical protein
MGGTERGPILTPHGGRATYDPDAMVVGMIAGRSVMMLRGRSHGREGKRPDPYP